MRPRFEALIRFLAIAFTALAMVPTGAHLLEMPNKLELSADRYLIVQSLYRGWSLSGLIVGAALLSTAALAWSLRRRPGRLSAAVAFSCIVATQIVFWTTTYPVNVETVNWTRLPIDWTALRLRWEYSHATSALFNLIALLAATTAVLRAGGAPRDAVRRTTG